ncbi:MAG: ferrochelatase [Bacteriovoracaceae bacterium]|nr:ferrochelatase [Bacteriovoracaceae bacterium]
MTPMKTGLWLIQLGTPDEPSVDACKKFLYEFLMDKRVIDIPFPFRWSLVHAIVPFRARKVVHAYRSVWLPNGSPLRVYSTELEAELQKKLGSKILVRLGMMYGNPSMQKAWEDFKNADVERLIVLPLYPQYASASSGSALEKVLGLLQKEVNIPSLSFVPPFFDQEFFIEALHARAKETDLSRFDHFLFSFHGLPERQIKKSDASDAHCLLTKHCCDEAEAQLSFCYRAQSVRSANLLAKRLNISPDKMSIGFQSRLGRTPWIRPYTDEIIINLAKEGKKRIAVFEPSFVADCLETLEEIGIRGRESFLKAGGEELYLVPSLNAHSVWVNGLSSYLKKHFFVEV